MECNSEIGLDGVNLCLQLTEQHNQVFLDEKALLNEYGKAYSHFSVTRGKLEMDFNFPLSIWRDNVKSFSQVDFPRLENMKNSLVGEIEWYLGEHDVVCNLFDCIVTSAEVNRTCRVVNGCQPHQIVNLVNRSIYHSSNKVYQRAAKECPYIKEDESVWTAPSRGNSRYYYKCYDKTREQINDGNTDVEDGLARLEVAFKRKALKMLFGADLTLGTIFTPDSLIMLIAEYKRVFRENLMVKHINPCLQRIENILFEHLVEHESPIKTVAKYRDIIVDIEILRRALKKWYKLRGIPDYSKQEIRSLKSCGLPTGVEKTIEQFLLFDCE